jgi:predicted ester cyclase
MVNGALAEPQRQAAHRVETFRMKSRASPIFAAMIPGEFDHLRGDAMTTLQVTEYERIWVGGLNRGDVSVADEAFAPDCVIHITGIADAIRGLDAWKQVVAGLLTAIPDLHFTIEEQVAVGDTVASRWHAQGTHTGPLGAVQPTGRRVSIDGLILDHLRDGRVVERWEQWDQSLMLQQLGLQ